MIFVLGSDHELFIYWCSQGILKFSEYPVLNKLKVLIINIGAWGDEILIGLTAFLTACPNLQKFKLQVSMLAFIELRQIQQLFFLS